MPLLTLDGRSFLDRSRRFFSLTEFITYSMVSKINNPPMSSPSTAVAAAVAAASSRLPTLREYEEATQVPLPDYNESDRKNREEESKDYELQARVDRLKERLHAMIDEKRERDSRKYHF